MGTSVFMIIGIISMFVMALTVILFVVLYQRKVIKHHIELREINARKELEILKASIQSEEEERKRIANELHDDVGATLSSARLFLNAADNVINIEQIATSKALIDEGIEKIRSVSHKLQPASLITLGLNSAINHIVSLLNKSKGLTASLIVSENFPRLESYTELHIYRILQEIITNINKHSNARRLNIEMYTDYNIRIKISHDGEGLTYERFQDFRISATGLGLTNIYNRLRIINGDINFYKDSENFSILISIPFSDETRES